MKKTIILLAILLLSGCLEKERVSQRDVTRTDSALVVLERFLEEKDKTEDYSSLEMLQKEMEVRKIKLPKVEVIKEQVVDTLFLEKTVTLVYTKKDTGGQEELILDSVNIQLDSCFHYYNGETKKYR